MIKRILIVIVLAVLFTAILAPWNTIAEYAIKTVLAARGFAHVELSVDSVSARGMKLHDVSLGKAAPVAFETVELSYTPESLRASNLTIARAETAWKGGMLSTKNAHVSWAGDQRLKADIHVEHVPLNELMQWLTGGRASASGMVSGVIPLSVDAKGGLHFNTGGLKAEAPGIIVLPPDAIPGNNEQIGQVRDILGNFHYNQFSLGLESGADKKLSILLQLSGNNPDVYNGREVKLNVHLRGDVLNLVQQSILPLADPMQLLKQE